MLISDFIKNEEWNGGNWIETFCEYGSYSITRNPNTRDDKNELLILVIDDPKDDEKPFYRMIPDSEVKDLRAIDTFVEKIYEDLGIGCGEIFEEYRKDFSLRKFNNDCWQVLYKNEVVGEYSSASVARRNLKYRLEINWGEKIGDALLEERRKLSEKCAEINKQLRGEL